MNRNQHTHLHFLTYWYIMGYLGGNAALLYASKYHDVPLIVNISGRFGLNHGIQGRLGKGFMQRITKHGFIDVKDKLGTPSLSKCVGSYFSVLITM